jgi:hypothetical protein
MKETRSVQSEQKLHAVVMCVAVLISMKTNTTPWYVIRMEKENSILSAEALGCRIGISVPYSPQGQNWHIYAVRLEYFKRWLTVMGRLVHLTGRPVSVGAHGFTLLVGHHARRVASPMVGASWLLHARI